MILLVTALLKTALKNKYVQAILRGLKPCVIGIVLATGIYMVLGNCFGTISAVKVNVQAIIITAILFAFMFGYKRYKKKKLSPIIMIVLSAVRGMVVYGV
jgi:chromate transporter